jgi:hypothetical protein
MEGTEAVTSHEGTYSLSENCNYHARLLGALKWIQQLTTNNEDPHARRPPPSNPTLNRLTEEQFQHNVQLLARLRAIESKYQKENQSDEKGKGRDDSKEGPTNSTPKMTPSTPTRSTVPRNSSPTPRPSPSFVASTRTYADVLSPRRPSSAIRRRPNFGSLPQDK